MAVLLAATAVGLSAQPRRPAPPDVMVKFQSARGFFESVWKKVFAFYGQPYVQPKYAEFFGSSGPCGGGGPAYYCIPQDTVYYNRTELVKIQNAAAARLHTDGDYAALIVLAHELGHAVAHRLGDREIFADRRENAADCMAGAATREAANARMLDPGRLRRSGHLEFADAPACPRAPTAAATYSRICLRPPPGLRAARSGLPAAIRTHPALTDSPEAANFLCTSRRVRQYIS